MAGQVRRTTTCAHSSAPLTFLILVSFISKAFMIYRIFVGNQNLFDNLPQLEEKKLRSKAIKIQMKENVQPNNQLRQERNYVEFG